VVDVPVMLGPDKEGLDQKKKPYYRNYLDHSVIAGPAPPINVDVRETWDMLVGLSCLGPSTASERLVLLFAGKSLIGSNMSDANCCLLV
jgi:hypothetical protein